MSAARLVLTTTGSGEEAERIAHALVEERLAACVNIARGVHSIYRWQGGVETADEALLLIKTTAQNIDKLRARLHDLHSYDLPEFLVLDIAGGNQEYLDWIAASVR